LIFFEAIKLEEIRGMGEMIVSIKVLTIIFISSPWIISASLDEAMVNKNFKNIIIAEIKF